MRYLLVIVGITASCFSSAHNQRIADSLYNEVQTSSSDSVKVKLLTGLCQMYWYSNPDSSIMFAEQAVELAEGMMNKRFLAVALNREGVPYEIKGDYLKAATYYERALIIFKELDMRKGTAGALSNLGLAYYYQSKFPKALNHFIESLSICESINDSAGIGRACNNAGMVYEETGDNNAALEYYLRSVKVKRELGNRKGMAATYNNIGLIYYKMNNYSAALDYMVSAKTINTELGISTRLSVNLDNIGKIYSQLGDFKNALTSFNKALIIREDLGLKEGVIITLCGIARLKIHSGHINDVDLPLMIYRADSIAREIGSPVQIMVANDVLSLYYEGIGKYKLALQAYKIRSILSDSIFNESKSKEIGKLEARYDFEKAEEEKELAIQIKRKEEEEERGRRDNLQYSGILIFLVFLGGSLLTMGKLSVPVRVAEGLVFFSFLLFFEFLLVLLDPYIESYSSGAPAYKLLFNALLAGMIFPLHAFAETKIKRHLM